VSIEERLRQVEGVAGIELELGEEGLRGIKVRMEADGDEAAVLDEIRRILTAYGLRSRREGIGVLGGSGGIGEPPRIRVRSPSGRPGSRRRAPVEIRRIADGLQVELRRDGRTIIRRGEATPMGAAKAMVAAEAADRGIDAPRVLGVRRVRLGEAEALVVALDDDAGPVVGAALCTEGITQAMWAAVDEALSRLTQR